MNDKPTDFDVLVVGAGPAGSSAATVLAKHGRRVALLEKDSFPRYHVGESMIPHCWYALDRLGVADRMDDSGFVVTKHSVQFVSTAGNRSKPFYFFQHDPHPSSKTWQVVRSEFDTLLRDNALEQGVTYFDRTAAKELLRDEAGKVSGVTAEGPEGERIDLHAKVTVDASGRDLFSSSKNKWRVADEKLNKVAVWTYFVGAKRDPGLDYGATTVAYLPNKGWFWYLPLANDLTSVGIVADADYLFRDTRDLKEILEREIQAQPWIAEHVAPACCTQEFHVTRDFSYRSRHCAEDGLVLVGDAFAFLDPVFSSGMFFALHGGVMVADAVHTALEKGDVSGTAFEEYGERFCNIIEPMRNLVHAFYDPEFSFAGFFKDNPDTRVDVTDVLVGNLERGFKELFDSMKQHAEIPAPLAHGRARVG